MHRLKKQDIQKDAFNQIKRHIIDMKLKGGDIIPSEPELAQTLGISRAVIRETLKAMEYLGMLDAHQGKGRFVREFNCDALVDNLVYTSESDLKIFADILEVRIVLEVNFLLEGMLKFTEEDFKVLDGLLDEFEELSARNADEATLIGINTHFHAVLHKYSRNQFLQELIRAFGVIQKKITASQELFTDRVQFLSCHRAIVESLRQKDAAKLQSAMKEHFSEALTWVAGKLETDKEAKV